MQLKGTGFQFNYAHRYRLFGVEGFYRKASYSGEILYDSQTNTLNHQQSSIGVGIQFYLTSKLFIRFGGHYNEVKHSFDASPTAIQEEILRQTYQLSDEKKRLGSYVGAQLIFLDQHHLIFILLSTDTRLCLIAANTQLNWALDFV